MPWKATSPVDERKLFMKDYLSGQYSVAELARRYGTSRKTAYKWIARWDANDGAALEDRSRRPKNSPNSVAQWLEEAIVSARKQRPTWGPKKLRAVLAKANPRVQLPSISTFAAIFKRYGLVRPRRRKRNIPPSSTPFSSVTGPNSLWCVDFKGQFRVGRTLCYPLTIMDAHSRFLIACIALPSTELNAVRRAFERVFAEFGIPEAIRSDNGTPFAGRGPCGFSQLSAWWFKLGIRHERIEPGKPQQNGRHERMHLTLKQETARPPASSMSAQQKRFDLFRRRYNCERPHEALGQQVPADHYEPSRRVLPTPAWGRDFEYEIYEFETTRVSRLGYARSPFGSFFASQALKGELLGIQWLSTKLWDVYFGKLRIGQLHRLGQQKVKFIAEPSIRMSPVSVNKVSPMSSK